jgi:DNA polymerase-3 subunit alpha
MTNFTHLHVHTQYSTLDGASQIPALVDKAIDDGMNAMAITDHGNMFGIKEFFNYTTSIIGRTGKKIADLKKGEQNDLTRAKIAKLTALVEEQEKNPFKPIIGCEVYVSPTGRFDKKGREDRSGNHLILLAKNKTGYHNLVKLVSLGFIEGFYYKPRIDKEILEKYREGLIVSSACIAGEVQQHIMDGNIAAAEASILWFKERFGDDYYLELQRHKTNKPGAATDVYPRQEEINPVLVELGRKLGVKCIVTNDVHFVNENEAEAHDRLLCISTAADVNEINRLRYTRQEWFKTRAEMEAVFPDHLEALENTNEIAGKVEFYDINSAPIMPDFPLPEGFENADEYLRHLTFRGAEKRYKDRLDEKVRERIDFELDTIKNMGYPGYFLIVQDFIAAARNMGVSVGPGRGSAAGSVVAYCLRITDIDPIRYDLLFERFLNPDRISMPDIDIDFDDDGRGQVLQWVTEKYGKERVAHIVTFGTMAAKSAIKDVARVQNLPLSEADRLSKLIDEIPRDKKVNIRNAIEYVPAMKEALNSPDPLIADTIKYAQMLEGTVRQTGVHACGVVIGRDDLTNYVPISTAFDKETNTDMLVTQYEGSLIEDVGMMKMDFLGLRTLSIIKDALQNIEQVHGDKIDIEAVPLDDAKTYELFSRGDTNGLFQFESAGMRKHLKNLKPTRFEDLIAMNALYRPGPMDYIPSFVKRKNGEEPVEYEIADMEEYLSDTYGITVYQEQVMLLSQKLGGFTGGQADTLRKAMGKKQREVLDKMKPQFIEGATAKGHDPKVIDKIWTDWEAFASYAFNKSHSTCYAYVAYQTGWLKAHYPSEFMAALLSRNLSDIKSITLYMQECKRMGMNVLGPDVNESYQQFSSDKAGNVRFGLGGIKGVGEAAVKSIIDERRTGGKFSDIYNFVERINLQSVNKKTLESLAIAGGLDTIGGFHRSKFFAELSDGSGTFLEQLIRYGSKVQSEKANVQQSLFGAGVEEAAIQRPLLPVVPEWSGLETLNKEREAIGIYLSSHPLDKYRTVIKMMCNMTMQDLENPAERADKEFSVAGMVTGVQNLMTQKGKPYGRIKVEDYDGNTHEFVMFDKESEMYRIYFYTDYFLFIRGKIQTRFGQEGNYEARISSIVQLDDVEKDFLKEICITVPLETIDGPFIAAIEKAAGDNAGGLKFAMRVVDRAGNVSVRMYSRKYKVGLAGGFTDFLDDNDMRYTIQ